MTSAIGASERRVWVAMFGLRASTSPRTRPLIEALAGARARGVSVRVLYDGGPRRAAHWARDAEALARLGVPARPWPLRSRLHVRSVLVDEAAFTGSVGWTPHSLFRAEELCVHLDDAHVVGSLAALLDRWWEIAAVDPGRWPVDFLQWPPEALTTLRAAGVRTLADLMEARHLDAAKPEQAARLREAARWIVRERFPAPVAALLSRAGVTTLDRWPPGTPAEVLDAALRPCARPTSALDLAPAGSYLARRLQRRG